MRKQQHRQDQPLLSLLIPPLAPSTTVQFCNGCQWLCSYGACSKVFVKRDSCWSQPSPERCCHWGPWNARGFGPAFLQRAQHTAHAAPLYCHHRFYNTRLYCYSIHCIHYYCTCMAHCSTLFSPRAALQRSTRPVPMTAVARCTPRTTCGGVAPNLERPFATNQSTCTIDDRKFCQRSDYSIQYNCHNLEGFHRLYLLYKRLYIVMVWCSFFMSIQRLHKLLLSESQNTMFLGVVPRKSISYQKASPSVQRMFRPLHVKGIRQQSVEVNASGFWMHEMAGSIVLVNVPSSFASPVSITLAPSTVCCKTKSIEISSGYQTPADIQRWNQHTCAIYQCSVVQTNNIITASKNSKKY